MADYLKIIEEWEREQAARKYTWKDFYPGLNPDEWEVTQDDRGICGKKIAGKLAGTMGFFIPAERLAEGPSTHPEPSSWDFKRVRIGDDVWMVGVADTGAETAWFVKDTDEVSRQ